MNKEDNLTIRVDFYKEHGKWYSGGNVNIGKVRMWQGNVEFMQTIVDNQDLLVDSWIGDYHVITSDLSKYDGDRTYNEFSRGFFMKDKFVGMVKGGNAKSKPYVRLV